MGLEVHRTFSQSLPVTRASNTQTGVGCALFAAALFGLSTPLAKIVSPGIEPVLLAGLLYLSSGVGLGVCWLFGSGRRDRGMGEASLTRADTLWLAGAIVSGGVIGPLLLMWGLRVTPASTASLLLNLEGVLTALIAWFAFRDAWHPLALHKSAFWQFWKTFHGAFVSVSLAIATILTVYSFVVYLYRYRQLLR